MDFIGTNFEFEFKTQSTDKWDTRYKMKWGKSGRKYLYFSGPFTRKSDKLFFRKILEDEMNGTI
jgi:hypothetical protein